MSLFKTVRKLLILGFLAALVAAGVFAYQNKEIFNPAVDAYWAYNNEGVQHFANPGVNGKVIKVLDGNWFHLKIPEGFVYAVRVTGMEAPGIGITLDPENPPMGNLCRTNLTELLLDQEVTVDVIEMNDRRYGQGFVYLNSTNVAKLVVQEGMGRLNRQEILGLEFEEKYELVRAERFAKERELGVYESGKKFDWATIADPPEPESAPAASEAPSED